MASSASRRSFLFGRQETADDRWAGLLARLRRSCRGTVKLLSPTRARLVPACLADVFDARRLTEEHGARLALDGLDRLVDTAADFVVFVEAGSAWGTLIPLGDTGLWRVDAGCPVLAMQAAGLVTTCEPDRVTNMAQWLSCWSGPDLAASGLVSVEWLFADGSVEVLGPFGARDSQPLRSATAQKAIPKIFELAASLDPAKGQWCGRYRLDALRADAVNLAHVVLGHGATLGWLIAATLKHPGKHLSVPGQLLRQNPMVMNDLDRAVKKIMDPRERFPCLSEQTG